MRLWRLKWRVSFLLWYDVIVSSVSFIFTYQSLSKQHETMKQVMLEWYIVRLGNDRVECALNLLRRGILVPFWVYFSLASRVLPNIGNVTQAKIM